MFVDKQIVLDLIGLRCAACVAAVERAVGKLDGVMSASANLASKKGTFVVDPSKVSVDNIITAIRGAGYDAAVPAALAEPAATPAVTPAAATSLTPAHVRLG
jgi:Cu+-exporting ATPase